ncbi:hypothetical protein SKAU_G00004010 [Synaphobranchus kaupii]|uniref:Uncharacterized protein n=1 Tax=Synaphobranchus kaupii TaxID=118154 RepID=A0A9Q1G9T3_SYNKA|nr:hypothetical protein SKAU_G00004010 [Synaphobranchus kaupii]
MVQQLTECKEEAVKRHPPELRCWLSVTCGWLHRDHILTQLKGTLLHPRKPKWARPSSTSCQRQEGRHGYLATAGQLREPRPLGPSNESQQPCTGTRECLVGECGGKAKPCFILASSEDSFIMSV